MATSVTLSSNNPRTGEDTVDFDYRKASSIAECEGFTIPYLQNIDNNEAYKKYIPVAPGELPRCYRHDSSSDEEQGGQYYHDNDQ